jgi:hypothetical protein
LTETPLSPDSKPSLLFSHLAEHPPSRDSGSNQLQESDSHMNNTLTTSPKAMKFSSKVAAVLTGVALAVTGTIVTASPSAAISFSAPALPTCSGRSYRLANGVQIVNVNCYRVRVRLQFLTGNTGGLQLTAPTTWGTVATQTTPHNLQLRQGQAQVRANGATRDLEWRNA